jgi:hypothetical protein
MLELNMVSIKSSEDLQEALLVRHSANTFVGNTKAMIDRWGLDATLIMLGKALCGEEGYIKPLLKFSKYIKEPAQWSYDEGTLEELDAK